MRLVRRRPRSSTAADVARLLRFRDRLREWRARREYVSFDRLLLAAIDDCGYRPEPGARGDANIDKFLAQARDAAAPACRWTRFVRRAGAGARIGSPASRMLRRRTP